MTRTTRLTAVFSAALALGIAGCSSASSHATKLPGTTLAAPATAAPRASSTTLAITTQPSACTPARPHVAGQSSQSFDFQGATRTYQLYVPTAYTGRAQVPVVFDFHGYGSNAVEQMAYGNFKPEADRDPFLIVAPDGQDPAARHFNLTGEAGLQNDVQMVGALLDHVEATFCVDAGRVYATGMSDGGAMTSVLACEMSNRFAAFAAVAVVVACGGPDPVPIMAFSGTADPIVPFAGGTVNCCGGTQIGAAPATMARWAEHDGCDAAFREVRVGTEVRRRTWSGCRRGTTVVFYIVDGGGHTWPGSIPIVRLGKTTEQVDASAVIWRFFRSRTGPASLSAGS
jgi:polyhydroxybutyrate depolymerase